MHLVLPSNVYGWMNNKLIDEPFQVRTERATALPWIRFNHGNLPMGSITSGFFYHCSSQLLSAHAFLQPSSLKDRRRGNVEPSRWLRG